MCRVKRENRLVESNMKRAACISFFIFTCNRATKFSWTVMKHCATVFKKLAFKGAEGQSKLMSLDEPRYTVMETRPEFNRLTELCPGMNISKVV